MITSNWNFLLHKYSLCTTIFVEHTASVLIKQFSQNAFNLMICIHIILDFISESECTHIFYLYMSKVVSGCILLCVLIVHMCVYNYLYDFKQMNHNINHRYKQYIMLNFELQNKPDRYFIAECVSIFQLPGNSNISKSNKFDVDHR